MFNNVSQKYCTTEQPVHGAITKQPMVYSKYAGKLSFLNLLILVNLIILNVFYYLLLTHQFFC